MSAARVPYGALKQAELSIRAAHPPARPSLPWLARVSARRFGRFSLYERIAIAGGLLRLQAERKLQVWIDGETIRVGRFTDVMRPPEEPYSVEPVRCISWARAAQIVDRGGLD